MKWRFYDDDWKSKEMFPQKFDICSLFLNVSSLRNNTATHEDKGRAKRNAIGY